MLRVQRDCGGQLELAMQAIAQEGRGLVIYDSQEGRGIGLMAKLQGPTTDFAAQGLPELTAAAVSLQQTSEALRKLIEEVHRSPQGLIAKAPSKEVEIKP